jgi:hypothetical protein
MPSMRAPRRIAFALVAFLLLCSATRSHGQAALLMEEPYGFFGTVNPTGHTAVYFAHICAETPTTLRRCEPGELGAVISRYSDVGYDWIAIPLIPYLYSVEDLASVPDRVDKETVNRLRDKYHEEHLLILGADVPEGGFFSGGWKELIGVAYERRMFAFRFNTTPEQDEAFIARMNGSKNRSHFQLLFNNCSDFSRTVLNEYFPRTFRRSFFPDAGMTTPKQITYKLERYARKHPEIQLTIFGIPQVPGYRRLSRANKSISESLITTGYAIPIAALNPYLAGGLFVDYVVRGRYHLIPKQPQMLTPETLAVLSSTGTTTDSLTASVQTRSTTGDRLETPAASPAVDSGLRDLPTTHE